MGSPPDTKFYDVLGVKPGCSPEALKSAYRKAALKHHPDKAKPEDRVDAEKRFKEIGRAYEVLSNPETRRTYDSYGEKGPPGGGVYQGDDYFPGGPPAYMFTGMDGESQFFDPFEQSIFEAMFGKTSERFLPKADPLFADLDCTLEELYSGGTKHVRVDRRRFVGSMFGGGNMTIDSRDFDIQVKPGWREGTRLTFENEGDSPSAGIQPGDLIVTIRELPHSFFRRDGDDLHCTVWVWNLTHGERTTIPFLDGTPMIVWDGKTPLNPSEPRIALGRGMVNSKTGQRGDLFLHFRRKFPMYYAYRTWRFVAPKGRLPDWLWWTCVAIGTPLVTLLMLRLLRWCRGRPLLVISIVSKGSRRAGGPGPIQATPLYML